MDIETENVINLVFPEGIPGKKQFYYLYIVNILFNDIIYVFYAIVLLQNHGKRILNFISICQNWEALM